MHLMNLAWRADLPTGRKFVLMAVCDAVNEHSGIGWPSVPTIALRCSMGDRTVQSHLDELEEHGLISRQYRTGRSTIYRVHPEQFPMQPEPKPISDQPPQNSHPRNSRTPAEFAPPQNSHLTPAGVAPPPPQNSHLTPAEFAPRTRRNQKLNPKGTGKRAASAAPIPDSFERFWEAWPRSPRKVDKADCKKRWERQGLGVLVEQIVAHVEAMKPTRQWKDGFEPAPATYLNGRRWEDELPPSDEELAARTETAGNWWESGPGVEARGAELGLERKKDEPLPHYRVRVAKEAGRGAWIDYVLKEAARVNPEFYRQVIDYLGEALMPTDFHA